MHKEEVIQKVKIVIRTGKQQRTNLFHITSFLSLKNQKYLLTIAPVFSYQPIKPRRRIRAGSSVCQVIISSAEKETLSKFSEKC